MTTLAAAKGAADVLREHGYEGTVYESTTGYWVVTVRAPSKTEADVIRTQLLQAALAPRDVYVSRGERFTRQVHP